MKKKYLSLILGGIFLLGFVGSAHAGLVTLDFDSVADPNDYSGVFFSDSFIITPNLADALNEFFPTSPSSALYSLSDLTITFDMPTDYVEFNYSASSFYNTTVVLTAYDSIGDSVGFGTSAGTFNGSFNLPTEGISYLTISGTNIIPVGDVDPGINQFIIDDFSFNMAAQEGPASVPEPATMLLFGTGLAGLAGSRFKRRKKQG